MPTYLVEFYLPRTRSAQARALAQRVVDAAGGAHLLRCVQVLSVPAEEYCLCLYAAKSARVVQDAVRAAGVGAGAAPVRAVLHSDFATAGNSARDDTAGASRCPTPPPAFA